MRMRHVLVCAALLLPCSNAVAQDTRKAGITMGYPASIGVLWHATDAIAIRPDFTFSGNSLSEPADLQGSSRSMDVGVSALFYMRTYGQVRTYVVPRLDYGRISNTESGIPSSQGPTLTRWSSSVTGSFGAQCALGDRFSIYGEVGFGYSHSKLPLSTVPSGSSNSWGTRSGVGVIFYP
jgi:hypothetical protein